MRKTTGTLLATLLLAATGGSALSAEVTVMISAASKRRWKSWPRRGKNKPATTSW